MGTITHFACDRDQPLTLLDDSLHRNKTLTQMVNVAKWIIRIKLTKSISQCDSRSSIDNVIKPRRDRKGEIIQICNNRPLANPMWILRCVIRCWDPFDPKLNIC